jgi:hypothetical protein
LEEGFRTGCHCREHSEDHCATGINAVFGSWTSKDAVQSATAFAIESLGPQRATDIRLEELETSVLDRKPIWLITLSIPQLLAGPLAAFNGPFGHQRREYKVFAVEKETGEVLSMKIRVLETATV